MIISIVDRVRSLFHYYHPLSIIGIYFVSSPPLTFQRVLFRIINNLWIIYFAQYPRYPIEESIKKELNGRWYR